MELTLENGKTYENPDPGIIERALRTLDGESNSYAILSVKYEIYMQACGGPADGFVLEYREGSEERHYQTTRDDVPLDEIIKAFSLYARGDDGWRSQFDWKPLDVTRLARRPGAVWILLPILGILAAWVISKLISR